MALLQLTQASVFTTASNQRQHHARQRFEMCNLMRKNVGFTKFLLTIFYFVACPRQFQEARLRTASLRQLMRQSALHFQNKTKQVR